VYVQKYFLKDKRQICCCSKRNDILVRWCLDILKTYIRIHIVQAGTSLSKFKGIHLNTQTFYQNFCVLHWKKKKISQMNIVLRIQPKTSPHSMAEQGPAPCELTSIPLGIRQTHQHIARLRSLKLSCFLSQPQTLAPTGGGGEAADSSSSRAHQHEVTTRKFTLNSCGSYRAQTWVSLYLF
jgi:hypothetical protein